jgi:ABC-type uncharacterized transport system YnjBCD ATPase subunit
MSAGIRFSDVSKTFRKTSAGDERRLLHNFSLTVEPGELIAFVGRSGIGKTTLLHLAAGLERPDSGSVETIGAHERTRVGMVFQQPRLLEWRTVWQNIQLAAAAAGVADDSCREFLAQVQLNGAEGRFPLSLSGGERQRVALARAFASFVMHYMDAVDPDLNRFLKQKKGKLLIYQGWADGDALPESIVHYYDSMVKTTFDGSYADAQKDARLFMMPGMGHCGGGPGPNEWDKLPVLTKWVEDGQVPDYIVAVHRSSTRDEQTPGPVTNERKLCPYPEKAVYSGPSGGQNDPKNWKQENFTCREK